MNIRLAFGFVLVAIFSMATATAMAVEPDFQIWQTFLGYSSVGQETKVTGSEKTKQETTNIETMPDSLTLMAALKPVVLYAKPTAPKSPIGIGYTGISNLEVGAYIGLNSVDVDKPKTKESALDFSVYATYSLELKFGTVELTLIPGMSSSSDETEIIVSNNLPGEMKTKTNGTTIEFDAELVRALAKNLDYVGGIAIVSESFKSEVNDVVAGTKETTNVTTMILGLKLAALRYKF